MAEYFQNAEDLGAWVRSRGSSDKATQELMQMINNEEDFSEIPDDEQDIADSCQAIYEGAEDASAVLFGVLAKHQITQLNKQASTMKKEAQTASRQRNDWTRSCRNKWNRCVDGYNDGTPWRIGRDEYYDFTHYATDEIRFDEDPSHIYSGEAIWRTYVMDKFYRDYKNKEGKVVGGYINDRFHVFPTAGTPANPDAPRDGGNQMELADGERTRQPRPHEYSTERRLEEARGNKTESITVAAKSFDRCVKIASSSLQTAQKDRIYNMFKDIVEMREAQIDYETMIESVADHYKTSILSVAQMDRVVKKLIAKHAGIGYEASIRKAMTFKEVIQAFQISGHSGEVVVSDMNGIDVIRNDDGSEIHLYPGATIAKAEDEDTFIVKNDPAGGMANQKVTITDMNTDSFEFATPLEHSESVEEAMQELEGGEQVAEQVMQTLETGQFGQDVGAGYGSDFNVTEIQPA